MDDCFNHAGLSVDDKRLDGTIPSEKHNIIADIAKILTKWRDLFPYFGLEEYEKEEIEAAGDLSEQKRVLVTRWIQRYGPTATFRHLCTILCEQHRLDLVRAVCEVVKSIELKSIASPALVPVIRKSFAASVDASTAMHCNTSPQQQSALSHFNCKLRARYAEYPFPHHSSPQCKKWIPHINKEYVHPDVISREEREEQPDSRAHLEAFLCRQHCRFTEKGRGNPVQLAKLFEVRSGEKCKCVLMEGGPGMGKSTLAWQVCHRWAKRELFSQYLTVVLLLLRDSKVQQMEQVEDLFHRMRNKRDQKLIQQEIGNGEATLIILDGLDELPGHLLSTQSIFTDLLSGEVLSDATILVTSRPSATQQLLTCWNRQISKHFVICGFSEKDVSKYIKSMLSGKKLTEFQKHLSTHSQIQAIMYVPLHSAIVMAVYLQYKELPETLTKLYKLLVRKILLQYIDDHQCIGAEKVACDVIGKELPYLVHTHFLNLCKFAYDHTCRQQLIFHDLPEELHDLGFTDAVPELIFPENCSYNFLHLSIQEFLAACHISFLNPQEQEQLLLRSREEHHFKNMMIFAAGITKFEHIRKETMEQVVGVKDEMVCHLDGYGLQLLYECQNVTFLDKEDTYSVSLGWSSQAHHYLALGSVIANSKCTWKLQLFLSNVRTEMFVQKLNSNTEPDYTIASMDIQSFFGDNTLLAQESKHFSACIRSLAMPPILRDNESITCLCKWLSICYQLETLSVPNLQHSEQGLDPELASKIIMLSNNTVYSEMVLREMAARFDHVEMVSNALILVPSLKILDMKGSKFTLQGMHPFTFLLRQNHSLTEVNISECNIDRDCTCCLAVALSINTTLRVLDMSRNSIGDEGALVMAIMLKSNTVLTKLDISSNAVGDKGVVAIAEMLEHNTTLTVLNMSSNKEGWRGVVSMANALKDNKTLTEYVNNNPFKVAGEAMYMYDFYKETKIHKRRQYC